MPDKGVGLLALFALNVLYGWLQVLLGVLRVYVSP